MSEAPGIGLFVTPRLPAPVRRVVGALRILKATPADRDALAFTHPTRTIDLLSPLLIQEAQRYRKREPELDEQTEAVIAPLLNPDQGGESQWSFRQITA
jgi:hypothetical protein